MNKSIILFIILILFDSCIERINFEIPDSYASQLVVDGVITDETGPYTVQLTRTSELDRDLDFRKFISAKSVAIFDNAGNSELLEEIETGIYQTKANGIRGVVGREYFLKIETHDGKVYESIPDKMNPSGAVDSIYYNFETFQPLDAPTKYGFRVYMDAHGVPDTDNLFRWRFTGTFEIDSYPDLHTIMRDGNPCVPDPRPCSGFIFVGYLSQKGPCTCCTCWVSKHEDQPHVSDNQFVLNGMFKKIEVGYVPLEYFPFLKKYRLEVKQMSLSQVAFDYWKTIQSQKEGASSLFQPPTGKTRGNIFEKNGQAEIQGLFYASAVKSKQIYITHADVKVKLQEEMWNCEVGIIAEDCRLAFPFSTTQKPADWK